MILGLQKEHSNLFKKYRVSLVVHYIRKRCLSKGFECVKILFIEK